MPAQPREPARSSDESLTHSGPIPSTEPGRRPRYFVLAWGLLEARVEHVDFFDTMGGEEIIRLYERSRARHRAARRR